MGAVPGVAPDMHPGLGNVKSFREFRVLRRQVAFGIVFHEERSSRAVAAEQV
jgi:hypothetical protein